MKPLIYRLSEILLPAPQKVKAVIASKLLPPSGHEEFVAVSFGLSEDEMVATLQ
jgi:hypothetical protein